MSGKSAMDHLMDEFSSKILDQYHDMDNESFDKEENFIEETVSRLQGQSINTHSGSVSTTTYSVHQSPKVEYRLQDGKTVTRELADILYLVDSTVPYKGQETRAMLSQAKFSKSPPSWNIDLYQYDLINRLPPFTVTSPRTYETFDIGSHSNTTLANFVMASRFSDPFYLSGKRMRGAVSNFNYATDSATYNPDRYHGEPKPTGYEYSTSILKRLVRRTYGQKLAGNPEIDRLVKHLRDIVINNYVSKPIRADGGQDGLIDDSPGFALVEIEVKVDNIEE